MMKTITRKRTRRSRLRRRPTIVSYAPETQPRPSRSTSRLSKIAQKDLRMRWRRGRTNRLPRTSIETECPSLTRGSTLAGADQLQNDYDEAGKVARALACLCHLRFLSAAVHERALTRFARDGDSGMELKPILQVSIPTRSRSLIDRLGLRRCDRLTGCMEARSRSARDRFR